MNTRFRPVLLAAILLALATFAQSQAGLPEDKVTSVFGQNMIYFEAGQGPTVILLHGLGAVKEIWLGNFGAVAAKYHVYAIDQIGFGHSDKPLLEYRIATFSDFLYGFMQSQNITKASLIGNSMGGWVALDFATQHPEMVDRLVLVDSAGLSFLAPPLAIDLNPASLAATRKMLEAIFYNKAFVTDASVQRIFADHMRHNDGYTIQTTLAGILAGKQFEDAKLSTIHAPTLIVWGHDDELLPPVYGDKLHDGIAGSRLVTFDRCGHVPQLEKAAEFNQAVLEFLEK